MRANPMRVHIRHYTVRHGQRGGIRRYWSASPALRAAGWRTVRLPDDEADAIKAAQAINAAADAFRAGTPTTPTAATRAIVLLAAPIGGVADDDRRPPRRGQPGPKLAAPPGTLAELIALYRASPDFAALAPKTRRGYEDHLDTLAAWDATSGHAPAATIGPRDLLTLHRALAARTPSKAAAVIRVASIVFGWGLREERYFGWTASGGQHMPTNPTARLRLTTPRPDRGEDDLWTPDDVAVFAGQAEAMGWPSVGLAVVLNAWAGQRQADILALPADALDDGTARIRQRKTGARVALPLDLVPALRAALDANAARRATAAVTATTLLVCETTGRAWSEHHFRHVFAAVRAEATKLRPGLAAKQYLTLRHTAVVRLAEAGCEIPEIASITGHSLGSVTDILSRYHIRTRAQAVTAFRKRLAHEAQPDG